MVSTAYSNVLANSTDSPKITAYWDDISTGTSGSGSKIEYQLFGSAPNRYLVVNFLMRVPYSTTSAYNSTFQVQLYETTNIIKLVYGTVVSGTSYSVGIGVSSSDFMSVSTAAHTASTSSENSSNSSSITSGRCYTFTPNITPNSLSIKTVLQATTNTVGKGMNNQPILALLIKSDYCNPSLTQITMNMTGSTSPTVDVTKIHIYYTGSSNTFASTTALDGSGTTVSVGTITISLSQTLTLGLNYIWVAYDISSSATTSNIVDAQLSQFTLDGTSYTPTTTNPSGSRTISTSSVANLASYPLTSDLLATNGAFGDFVLSGTTSGPDANGVYFNGVYGGSLGTTPYLTTMDATNFEIQFEASASSVNKPILVGGSSGRWIMIGINSASRPYVSYDNWTGTVTSTTTISTGTYYTYRLTYNAGALKLYLNGTIIISATIGSPLDYINDIVFLTSDYSSGYQFHGYLRNLSFSSANPTISVLPVELNNFGLSCSERKTKVSWSTVSETNNDFFTIERSPDGYYFEPIALVDGAGNSRTLLNYEYTDELNNNNKLHYYRLKQTDFDGETKIISNAAIACLNDTPPEFKIISCSRIENELRINLSINQLDKPCTLMIHDMLDREIGSKEFVPHDFLNVVSIPFQGDASVYIISVRHQTEVISEKIIVHQ